MNVTGTDIVLAVEIFMMAGTLFAAATYTVREIERLREQLRSIESEVKEHRKEIYTGDDR